jgi:hypothetical protein
MPARSRTKWSPDEYALPRARGDLLGHLVDLATAFVEILLRDLESSREPRGLLLDINQLHVPVAVGPAKSEDIDPITGKDGLVKTRLL